MESSNRPRLALCIVLLLLAASPAFAQDIELSSEANLAITDGDAASVLQTTDFGTVLVEKDRTRTFRIHNTSNSTTLTVSVFINSNPAHFTLGANGTSFSAPPSGFATFTIQFHPTSAGLKTSHITIQSNDPDSESIYDFDVAGTGQLGGPLPTAPDLKVTLLKPLKPKLNRSTGNLSVKMKLQVSNLGTAESTTPTLVILRSQTEVQHVPALIAQNVTLKPLPGVVNGKIKKKTVNVKLDGLPNANTWLFAIAASGPLDDLDYIDNITNGSYRGVGP